MKFNGLLFKDGDIKILFDIVYIRNFRKRELILDPLNTI